MNKLALSLIVITTLCTSNVTVAGGMGKISPESDWTGFYLGGNAGYWESQSNKVVTNGSTVFVNQTFTLGASNITNALVQVATNNFALDSYGFIGGGQLGYNYQSSKGILVGLETDFDGLTNSHNTFSLHKVVNLIDFDETYIGSLSLKQTINYLGTLHGRLGYLFHPTFLVYGTGGFAYGNVTLDTNWTANESLGPNVFPTISSQNKLSKTLTGWTAGAGVEWLFKSNWSARLEYTYYDLNHLNASALLSQINGAETPPVLWGSASANTDLSVSVGTIRVGVNYHFS